MATKARKKAHVTSLNIRTWIVLVAVGLAVGFVGGALYGRHFVTSNLVPTVTTVTKTPPKLHICSCPMMRVGSPNTCKC